MRLSFKLNLVCKLPRYLSSMHVRSTMKHFPFLLSILVLFFLVVESSSADKEHGGDPRLASLAADDPDSDGDGLSDFQETHKYFSDPAKKSTAGKGVSDGDWDERRQFTYSIRTIVRVMPPYNLNALNDDYQDVRVRKETKDYVELEVISYPLNTNADAIIANRSWKKDYAGMKEFLQPGITTNWDPAMRKDLLAELAKSGIDPDKLTDKEVVEKVARWTCDRCAYKSMFGTMFVDFPDKKPAILPGLEKQFDHEKGDPKWSVEEEFAHELLGKEMYANRSRGSCTSSAVLLTTVLRAVGIPTRMIVAIPIVDMNDPEQVALVEKNIHHHRVRAQISDGLVRSGQGFANHSYNEVYIGNRWRRLNYHKLGQNILDDHYFGLLIHVHTYNDLSEAGFAPTWGKRYALGLRDDNFKTSNPYRTLEITDVFGRDAKVENPPTETKDHKVITISKAYWLESKDAPEMIREKARRPKDGEAHLYVHGEEWFPDQDHLQYRKFMTRADKSFVLRAEGQPDIKAEMQMSFWTHAPADLRDILIVIPKEEFAKMTQGVAYTLHPANSVADYQWKVKKGLTITREVSMEEKLDALQKKVEKLEKRVEELEKKKREDSR
jgi:hypothetical protein